MRRAPAALALLACLTGNAARAAEPAPPASDEPRVQRSVVEDDGVRIEELRVRGQRLSIHVQPKSASAGTAARPYQIVTGQDGRDLSQDRRAAGQRVWSVLSF